MVIAGLLIVLVLLFAAIGGYHAHRGYGPNGLAAVAGVAMMVVVIIVIIHALHLGFV